MKWVCPDCGNGGPIRTDRPVTIGVGADRYTLETLDENRCRSCDEVKSGILVGDCPNHGGAAGARCVEYFTEDPMFHYCRKCDTHLYYEQDRDDYPHNAEPYCPLCHDLKSRDELDFHHWDYENDTGVQLCRDCHNTLHNGQTVSEQINSANDGESWKDLVFENLIALHKEHHERTPLSWHSFAERYNLPSHYGTPGRIYKFKEEFGVAD